MTRTGSVASAVFFVLIFGCNDTMEKTPAGVCAKMKRLALTEGHGEHFDTRECLAMLSGYPERDAAGFAALATCMENAKDVNGVQTCLVRGFAFAAVSRLESEPTQVARSDIKIEREIKIRADPQALGEADKQTLRLSGKFLTDVTMEDLTETIQDKGWKYEGGSSIMGAVETITVEGSKGDKKLVVTIMRPSEDSEALDAGADFVAQQKKIYETTGAIYEENNILVAAEVEGDQTMAEQFLTEIIGQ